MSKKEEYKFTLTNRQKQTCLTVLKRIFVQTMKDIRALDARIEAGGYGTLREDKQERSRLMTEGGALSCLLDALDPEAAEAAWKELQADRGSRSALPVMVRVDDPQVFADCLRDSITATAVTVRGLTMMQEAPESFRERSEKQIASMQMVLEDLEAVRR